ncbi:MAG: hemolysin family protein [Acidobacteriota bacterium]
MTGDMFLLILYAGGAIAVSFLCSMLEATLLSSRRIELEERAGRGDKGATKLLELKLEKVDDALSAILILNTLAHTIGATLAGAQAGRVFGDEKIWIVTLVSVFTFIFTIGVLLLSEIIPKTLGTVYSSRLIGFTGHAIDRLVWLLDWVLKLTRVVTKLLANKEKNVGISRRELAAMVEMAARDGNVQANEVRVLSNVLRFDKITVEDVMTPRTVVHMLPVDTDIGAFLADQNSRSYSRIPLYRKNRDDVVGYILQREVLADAAIGRAHDTPIEGYNRSAVFIPEGQSVGRALQRLIDEREHMALVTDEYGGISGLVSMEDLVETTLGVEILDESDRVADLRQEALKLRDRRLETLRKLRQDLTGENAEDPSEANDV